MMRIAHRFNCWIVLVSALWLGLAVAATPSHAPTPTTVHAQGHPMPHADHYPGGHGYRGFHGFYSVGYWNGCGPGWDWSWGPTMCAPWGWGPYYSGVWMAPSSVQWVVTAPVTPAARGVPSPELYVYPSKGQSDEQIATDRYECHKWALTQTGFDPTQVNENLTETEASAKREDYTRALTACLTGRGYSVK